jgi:AbrB family looped-hinge helix DNA binding protein
MENAMNSVSVSPKFQIVIPRAVRERVRIRPGDRLQVFSFDDHIALVPMRPMRDMRGFLKGLDARLERDKDDRS